MRELITTVCRGQAIQLLWQPELEEIEAHMEQGFVQSAEPVRQPLPPAEDLQGKAAFPEIALLHLNGEAGLLLQLHSAESQGLLPPEQQLRYRLAAPGAGALRLAAHLPGIPGIEPAYIRQDPFSQFQLQRT